MMLNEQPIEKKIRGATGTLEIHSMFYTIQGEGPFSGTPALFVRTSGCNFQCPWCDTEYTDNREVLATSEVLTRVVQSDLPRGGLVVITGGEPFRQADQAMASLIEDLVGAGYYVQVETNGSLAPPKLAGIEYQVDYAARKGVYIVCSPKAGKVNIDLSARACCFKYVLAHDSVADDDGLPILALGHAANPRLARPPVWWDRPVYLQPADHKDAEINALNMQAAVASCLKYGYILQMQIHKEVGLE